MKSAMTWMMFAGLALTTACGAEMESGGDFAAAEATGGGEDDGSDLPPAGQLTAGEWSDLENWSFWVDLLKTHPEFLTNEWRIETQDRVWVRVESNGEPVADAKVRLVDDHMNEIWDTRTDIDGNANLFEDALPGLGMATTIRVNRGDETIVMPIPERRDPTEPVVVEMDNNLGVPANVDVAFVVDTTGSMGDELDYIRAELVDVIQRAEQQVDGARFRVAGAVYRDKGDTYLSRGEDFSSADDAASFFENQDYGGGGDFPEAVEAGLEEALEFGWSESARARILFLVLDAPPHADRAEQVREATRQAAERGIRIIPVAASGVDRSTERLLRYMAITTGGTYTFITGHSGIGDDHLEPTVGKFEVELLNDMLVRLILERSVGPQ